MAVTANPVTLNNTSFTQISSAAIQSIQVKAGNIQLIFSDAQPAADQASEDKSHPLVTNQIFSNSTGGTSWGRATGRSTGKAIVVVTEN